MDNKKRRQRKANRLRQNILDAARTLFLKEGYSGASMPKLAETLDLATGTIYRYFPSKAVLYCQLLAEGYDLLRAALAEAVAREKAPNAQATALIDAFFHFAHTRPEYFDILSFLLQGQSGHWRADFPANLRDDLDDRQQQCLGVLEGVLLRMGYLNESLRAASAEALWAMLAGVVAHFNRSDDRTHILEQVRRIILKGVLRQ